MARTVTRRAKGLIDRLAPAETGVVNLSPPGPRDLMVVTAVLAVDLGLFWEWWTLPVRDVGFLLTPVVALLVDGTLLWRRLNPVVVYATVWTFTAAASIVPAYHPYPAFIVALFALSVSASTAGTLLAWLLSFGPLLLLGVVDGRGPSGLTDPSESAVPTLLWWLVSGGVCIAGTRVRAYRMKLWELDARRQAAALEAVAAERLRIARDLHDILAHSVSVMVLQAAGALRLLDRDPVQADRALRVIEETGMQSMQELRRLLGVLRVSGDQGPSPNEDFQPGISDVEALVEVSRQTGLDVKLQTVGQVCRLDPSVELAAYRMIQECLTNVRKHVGATAYVSVTMKWADTGLQIEVCNNRPDNLAPRQRGRGGTPSPGYGLLGLGERVTAIGGWLEAQETDGEFVVRASLPRSTVNYGGTPPPRPATLP